MGLRSCHRIAGSAAALGAGVALGLLLLTGAAGCVSEAARSSGSEATASQPAPQEPAPEEHGKLEPRYQPREPQPKPWYNDSYLFGMTRGVTGSTMHPAAKAPLLVLTIPLDIVLLPFAAIGGLFG